jgi:short-subunit dehydrogenase
MTAQGSGHIVNVLSIAAKVVFPGASAYCASKWGALGLTKALAEETRGQGVKVTGLCPGSIDTPFWDATVTTLDRRDMLRPEDVAATVRMLLEQPPGIYTDEMVVMPPKGIL